MNFIKALEKAQGLGVTNDEFIHLWKAELNVPPQNAASGILSQVTINETDQDGSSDQLAHQQLHDRDEYTQALHSKLEALLDKHTEKQERIWQQVHTKNDQMAEEFRQQFETVCQHVKNTAECQANSLKLFFMHELEIMKQNLVKMIDDRCNETSAPSSAGWLQAAKVDLNQESGNGQENSLGIRDMKCDMDDNELLPRAGYMAASLVQHEIQEEKQRTESFSDADYDWLMESANESPSLKDKKLHTSDDGEECDSASLNSPLNEKKVSRSYYVVSRSKARGSPTLNSQAGVGTVKSTYSSCSPVTPLDDASMEATGFYAKAISDQIKRSHSQSYTSINDMASDKDWDSSSEQENVDYASRGKKDLARPQIFNYLHWDGFNIADIASYRDSKSYMSPYLHPGTQSWKARLCISFDAGKQLKVRVCFTEGDGDMHHEWPIRITANGFIFHEFSKHFTQIWALPWVTCYKPSAREVKFSAKICLATKRGSYPDVTYNELKEKHYLENNKALLKWNLKAEKWG